MTIPLDRQSATATSLANVDWRPGVPGSYNPPIGLIGCGAIAEDHLRAYRNAGLQVTALCDLNETLALKRRQDYFPDASVHTDYRDLLRKGEIEVVDIATHPEERSGIIAAAIDARKHILSQKPFVIDLDEGARLVEAADRRAVTLAVNQNGRWAPHFCFLRKAIAAGILGTTSAAHFTVYWDHTWVRGTRFEKIKQLILYDFGIHWFDMARCLLPSQEPRYVYASNTPAPGQTLAIPLMAQAAIEFSSAQATMAFGGFTAVGCIDSTLVVGEHGTGQCVGPSLLDQSVSIHLADQIFQPPLTGRWFPDGFQGTMVELLHSVEQRRPCSISAADNLKSLALCFAAVQSAETGLRVVPGTVRRLPGSPPKD